MRVVIFCDMEGISCNETWEQVSAGKPFYEESRKLYTDEMNAAVRGARAAGASDISVVDCHGAGGAYSFKSFLPDRLESGAQYVFGYPWARYIRSEEHTSELQSHLNLVCRLLLEKKKKSAHNPLPRPLLLHSLPFRG